MFNNDIHIQTNHYDGPLGLLLLLVQKERMDIYDLDINRITQQYLSYLKFKKDLDFNIAGEFLFMAAVLCHIKSSSCLRKEEGSLDTQTEEDLFPIQSKTELIKSLEELQHFQNLVQNFTGLSRLDEDIFDSAPFEKKILLEDTPSSLQIEDLTLSMLDLIHKEKKQFTVIQREKLSLREKFKHLKKLLIKGEKIHFRSLLHDVPHDEAETTHIILTFLTLLELARVKKIHLFQNEVDDSIYLHALENLDDYNLELESFT